MHLREFICDMFAFLIKRVRPHKTSTYRRCCAAIFDSFNFAHALLSLLENGFHLDHISKTKVTQFKKNG
ncbi:hypothetical protein QE152_g37851 [Popillia japonica]|uniref:Uncharacterized protein n=1 Tax=Popillia japonica TaxID=7064 RepID=A0AAW1I8S4_POPJA